MTYDEMWMSKYSEALMELSEKYKRKNQYE